MPLFKNFITVPYSDEGDHTIVRKSKYIFYGILFFIVLASLLFIATLLRASINIDPSSPSPLGGLMSLVVGGVAIIAQLVLRGFIIGLLVRYFYSMTVITPNSVLMINYTLNLKENIYSANYEGILTVNSIQSGLMQTMLDYGDVMIKLENNSNVMINNIPNPKLLVKRINAYLP